MPNGNDRFSPFDVLEKLKDTGFEQEQAEFLARFLSDVEFRNMATKKDVAEIKRDIKELDTGLKRDIKELDAGLKRDIKELDIKIETIRSELKRDIKELDTGLRRDIKEFELKIDNFGKDIKSSQNDQTLKIILSITGIMAGLLAMFGFVIGMLDKS